jgi:hypothetical protein
VADHAVRGLEPELFELIGLAAGPGNKFIQAPGVEPPVGTRQGSQGTPARCLALDTQPQELVRPGESGGRYVCELLVSLPDSSA